jgi:hypothetical protein
MTEDDLWSTDSGLLSDYEGTVVDAWFGVNPQYNADVTMLFLKMQTDVDSSPEVTEQYNCGPDWQTIDGGKTVIHPTKMKFNRQSQAGILVDKVTELAGKEMRERGMPPTTALSWVGSRWFMEAVTREGTRRDTGEKWQSTRNYPAKFLGFSDGSDIQALHDGSGMAVGTPRSPLDSLDPAAVAKVTTLAKTLTHAEWVDKVMEIEGVLANDELVVLLPDADGLYAQLRSE